MTYYGWRKWLDGYNVYSNYQLNFPYKRLKRLSDIETANNGILLLDDLEAWLSSRQWKSKESQEIMQIILQGGKRNLDLIYSCKRPENIDVLLRDTTDYWVKCNLLPNFVAKDIIDFENKASEIENLAVQLEVYDYNVELVNTTYIKDLEIYCHLYSTYEEISKFESERENR